MAARSRKTQRGSWVVTALCVLVALMIVSRVGLTGIDAITKDGSLIDLAMTVLIAAVIIGGFVYFRKFFSSVDSWDYDPPLGKSPTMPGYYEDHYEGIFLLHGLRMN